MKIFCLFILIPFFFTESAFSYFIEKGDDLGSILYNQGYGPLWGKAGYVKKTIELNKKQIKKKGDLIYLGEEIELPLIPEIENRQIIKSEFLEEVIPEKSTETKKENEAEVHYHFSSEFNFGQYYLYSKFKTSFDNGESTLKTDSLSPLSLKLEAKILEYEQLFHISSQLFFSKNKSSKITGNSLNEQREINYPLEFFVNVKFRKMIKEGVPSISIGIERENIMSYGTVSLDTGSPLSVKLNKINSMTLGFWYQRKMDLMIFETAFDFIYALPYVTDKQKYPEFKKIYSELRFTPVLSKWSFHFLYQKYLMSDIDGASDINKFGAGVSYFFSL